MAEKNLETRRAPYMTKVLDVARFPEAKGGN